MSTVVLVTAVGDATGSKAAAAALACAGSEPDRAGLLIDLGGRAPRPTLVASGAARQLEERLAVHLPEAGVAARGQVCHLSLPDDPSGIERVPAALALVRESIAVVHLPPRLLRVALGERAIALSGALLRADLEQDRALTALAVRDLIDRGLRVAVLKRPLAWVPSRRALFGVLPAAAPGGLSSRLCGRLLAHNPASHTCYFGGDDSGIDPERTAQQQRRDHAGPGRGRGLHRHPQREARR